MCSFPSRLVEACDARAPLALARVLFVRVAVNVERRDSLLRISRAWRSQKTWPRARSSWAADGAECGWQDSRSETGGARADSVFPHNL